MTAVFINAILLIIAFVLGYAMQPRISRKLSYHKRGQAAKKRAYVKKAAKVGAASGAIGKGASAVNTAVKLNGSAGMAEQSKQDAARPADTGYANGGEYSR